jgi:hypothetical protein
MRSPCPTLQDNAAARASDREKTGDSGGHAPETPRDAGRSCSGRRAGGVPMHNRGVRHKPLIPALPTSAHSRESGNPGPRILTLLPWIPAFAGMTGMCCEAWRIDGSPADLAPPKRSRFGFAKARARIASGGGVPAAGRGLFPCIFARAPHKPLSPHCQRPLIPAKAGIQGPNTQAVNNCPGPPLARG